MFTTRRNATMAARRVQNPKNKARPAATSPRNVSRAKIQTPGSRRCSMYHLPIGTPVSAHLCNTLPSNPGSANHGNLSHPSKIKKMPNAMRTTRRPTFSGLKLFDDIDLITTDELLLVRQCVDVKREPGRRSDNVRRHLIRDQPRTATAGSRSDRNVLFPSDAIRHRKPLYGGGELLSP